MDPNDTNQRDSNVKGEPKPPKSPTPPVSGPLASLEAWLYKVLVAETPFQLPAKIKDFIVQWAPWITLVIAILLLPTLFAVFAVVGWFGAAVLAYANVTLLYWIAVIMLLLQLVLMFISIPLLLKRQRSGWLILFYSELLSLAYAVFNSFSYGFFSFGSLLWSLIATAIGLYFIFQVRSYYTK